MRRLNTTLVLLTAATALSGRGGAQSRGHVLHRPIPGDLPVEATIEQRHVTPPASSQAVQSAAGVAASGWEPQQPVDESVTRPRASWEAPMREMDRLTQSPPGARLNYTEVFTPAVSPFKRLQAYDTVDELGRLTIRDPALRPMIVGESGPAPRWIHERRARFIGELLVEVSPSWPTPVPGVAGEQRVLSYTTSSGHAVEFARDSSGNLFVRGLEPETIRLTYLLEAPESALQSLRVPPMSLAEAIESLAPGDRPAVPSWLRVSSERVFQRVGVSRSRDTLDSALQKLVGYFRAFRDAQLPDTIGADVYSDLALGGVGACRHRAYALMLTLHALGVPARYVGNEAHAWIEVAIPRGSWTRIDLGGWNVPLDAQSPTERPRFQPSNADPFPRPEQYTAQYSAAAQSPGGAGAGNGTQLGGASAGTQPTHETIGGAGPAGDPAAHGSGNAGGAGASSSGGSGALPSDGHEERAAGSGRSNHASGVDGAEMGITAASGGAGGRARGDDDPREEALRTLLSMGPIRGDEAAGFDTGGGFVRGSMVRVEGEARDERGPASGLAIEMHLVHTAGGRESSVSLGQTVSRLDGRWEARVLLPTTLDTGAYRVRATTAGDARHSAATAE